jgi:hypothetical protein
MPGALLEAVSFTAARDWDARSAPVALNVLAQVPPTRRYITGGCRGGDAFLGLYLACAFPRAWHVVVLPANRSQVDPWWEPFLHLPPAPGRPRPENLIFIEMPPGSTYEDRNAELARRGTVTYGLPAYPEDDPRSARSGTWQTIRMARAARTLISWCCVQPPYHGRIEGSITDFLRKAI